MSTRKLTTQEDYEDYGITLDIDILESYISRMDCKYCRADKCMDIIQDVKIDIIDRMLEGEPMYFIPEYHKRPYKISLIELLEKKVPLEYQNSLEINELLESKHQILNTVLKLMNSYRRRLECQVNKNTVVNNERLKRDRESMLSDKIELFDEVVSGTFTNDIPKHFVPIIKQELIRIFEIK